jgi:hypothetical protein
MISQLTRLDRVGSKTEEVVTGVAMPGHFFHNNPILVEYAKVLVREITDMGYTDYPLNHVIPEGVKELGQAVFSSYCGTDVKFS